MKRFIYLFGLILAGLMVYTGAPQAQSPANSVALSGFVVRAGTNEPIRGASVTLFPESFVNFRELRVLTDGAGNFQFINLPSGSYIVSAGAEGYLRGEYGQRGPTGRGTPVTVLAGQPTANVIVRLNPLGSISGRVYSNDGNPLQNAGVQLYKAMYVDGRRTMLVWQQARTNEFGEYRFPSLQPGGYVVSAFSPGTSGRGNVYLPVYSPGTIDIDSATLIDLVPGLEYGGADVTITERDALRIRGRVFDALSQTVPSAFFVALSPLNQQTVIGGATAPRQVTVAADATFELTGIVPGSYELIATLGDGESRLAARVNVEARSRDVEDLLLMLQPAFQIAGRVIMDGIASPDDARNIQKTKVSLVQEPFIAQVSPLPATVAEDGVFVLKGMIPGSYRIRVDTEFDSFVSRANWGAADILNSVVRIDGNQGNELYVQLDRRVGTLNVAVFDDRNAPAAGVQVVLAPESPNRERGDLYRSGRTNPNGIAEFKAIDPGDYKVFSWETVESGIWRDLSFLPRYDDLGKRIHISEGAQQNTDVRLIVSRR